MKVNKLYTEIQFLVNFAVDAYGAAVGEGVASDGFRKRAAEGLPRQSPPRCSAPIGSDWDRSKSFR